MCFETFDLNQPEKYIGKICLYKENSWDSNYKEIKVIDVSNGFIKYKYCNNESVSITDIDYFEGKRFIISPFFNKQNIVSSNQVTCAMDIDTNGNLI